MLLGEMEKVLEEQAHKDEELSGLALHVGCEAVLFHAPFRICSSLALSVLEYHVIVLWRLSTCLLAPSLS